MQTLELVLGIILLVMAIFLVISVLMQSSKNHRLSGTIAGGAETFFGKSKGKTIDALLNKLTTIISILFVICVLAIYVIQKDVDTTAQNVIDPAQMQQMIDDAQTEAETQVEAEAPEAEAEVEAEAPEVEVEAETEVEAEAEAPVENETAEQAQPEAAQ